MAGTGVAGVGAVWTAIGRAVWRDLSSFQSITGNNFFYFLMLVGLQPESAAFFGVILVALLLFPLSASPMDKVPAERWLLWPLTARERMAIQAGCLLLSPVTWLAPVVLWRAGTEYLGWFVGTAVGIRGMVWLAGRLHLRTPRVDLLGWVPAAHGWFGAIFRLQLREMLTTLDPYVAAVLALATILYRAFDAHADAAAFRVMALVSVIALSTSAQVLFGLNGAGLLRFRLWPLRGWQVLLAKDAALVAVAALVTVGLDLAGGLTGALVALAIGHRESVLRPENAQTRWRFTSGALTTGLLQTFAVTAATAAEWQKGWWVVGLAGVVWMGSVWFYGGVWERG